MTFQEPFQPFLLCLLSLVVKTFNVVNVSVLVWQLAYVINGQWEPQNLKRFNCMGQVILLLWKID